MDLNKEIDAALSTNEPVSDNDEFVEDTCARCQRSLNIDWLGVDGCVCEQCDAKYCVPCVEMAKYVKENPDKGGQTIESMLGPYTVMRTDIANKFDIHIVASVVEEILVRQCPRCSE